MNVYDFIANTINGKTVSLEDYRGKVLLIVNTASKCGFAPQFEDLQKLYEKYQSEGLEILGFPCNQFAEQEPGTGADISSFCQRNYGVFFPIFEKVKVNGKFAHPLFKFLKETAPFQGLDMRNSSNKILSAMINEKFPEFNEGNAIRWNFTKFLIDRDGKTIERFESSIEPLDLESNIKELIKN